MECIVEGITATLGGIDRGGPRQDASLYLRRSILNSAHVGKKTSDARTHLVLFSLDCLELDSDQEGASPGSRDPKRSIVDSFESGERLYESQV